MDSPRYKQFFLQPTQSWHRRYEVLRAVFVEQRSLHEVAQRFGLQYQTVANWACLFRRQCEADSLPPFSSNLSAVVPARDEHPTNRSLPL